MSWAEEFVDRIETVGAALAVNGDHIHYQVPENGANLLPDARAYKAEILASSVSASPFHPCLRGCGLSAGNPNRRLWPLLGLKW
jgi:hypothetical protein